jgi:hypothetical protein
MPIVYRSRRKPRASRNPPEASSLVEPPEDDRPPRSRALIGLLFMALLLVAAVYLVHALREKSRLEDCLMSGRGNCAPISLPGSGR